MRKSHKKLKTMARRMRSLKEIRNGTSLFLSKEWGRRKAYRAFRVKSHQEKAHQRAVARQTA